MPPTNTASSGPVFPPIYGAPFVQEGNLSLTTIALNMLQQIWSAVFGSGGIVETSFQTGDLKAVAHTTPEDGWLLADGTAYQQSAEPALFAKIGITWGSTGPFTFRVPNFQGVFPMGSGGAWLIKT